MTLAVSPGFFWTLFVIAVLTITALWIELYALNRDFTRLEKNRDFWENRARLQQRIEAPLSWQPPTEFDI